MPGMPRCFWLPPPFNGDAPWLGSSVPGIGIPGEAHRALRWVGTPRLGWGFLVKRTVRSGGLGSGWGAASSSHERLSLGENEARSNAPPPSPNDRRDQPRPPNGVQREKGLTLQPPDRTEEEGLEHSNHRPMLLAESYVKSAAAALPQGRLNVQPGSREGPPGFYGGKRWKSLTTQSLSTRQPTEWKGLRAITAKVLSLFQ